MLDNLLQIVLGILAFLGITLLVILGVILVVLLLVLFVPIRYNGEFAKDAEHMQLQAKASWLLHIVRVCVNYEKELVIKAYVLFWSVYDSSKPAKEKTKKEEKPKTAESAGEIKPAVELSEESIETVAEQNTEESAEDLKEEAVENNTDEQAEETFENHADDTDSAPKQSFIEKIKSKIQNIICKCRSICDKIKSIVQNINYYLEILKDENTVTFVSRCKERIFKVLKSIRPRKLTADLLVGTGSPDSTGYVMAVAGMLYPVFGKSVNITPDFEKTIFEGRIFLKGRITVFVILLQALKIFMDKELRRLLKRLKREDA